VLIALTGATGFLGHHVAASARLLGHSVRGLVPRLGPPVPPGVEPVEGMLADPAAVSAFVHGADVLVHLAACGVQSRDRAFERMTRVNVTEPLALLELARDAGVRRVVAVGSYLEYTGYGRLPDAPASEEDARPLREDDATEPAGAYGATKSAGGLLLRARARELGLPTWYLRLASLYGLGDDPGRLVPSAVRAAVAQEPFETTEGAQVREWLHADDAVRAVLSAAVADPPQPATIVNVGTSEGIAQRDVVRLVFEIAGADPGLVRAGALPYRAGDVHRLVMDTSRARAALRGFRAATPLSRGLDALVRHARAMGAAAHGGPGSPRADEPPPGEGRQG
jgi:nucleoside-diphosphate-sugar epimerase